MPIYRTSGVLTGTIEPENVARADAYLREHDMTEFLDGELADFVEHIEWKLEADGHSWNVTVFARSEMPTKHLDELSSWVSGQNSDGLGESFEQQDFAELRDASEEDCGECDGHGWFNEPDDEGDMVQVECSACGGDGYFDREDWGMISFDWEKNPCTFERVK